MSAHPDRLRVAALQYHIRPIPSFDHFRDQVSGLVETVADYKCQLVVFPEYFTVQLLTTLGDVKRPVPELIRELAALEPRYLELMSDLARRHRVYIVGGTLPVLEGGAVYNRCFVFGRSGDHGVQGKLHMTRFETEEWLVSASGGLRIFETDFGRLAVAICYDIEFPEMARAAAREGVNILAVPSCTDDRQGFLRVRYCAHARAIENQLYVIHSPTVGSLPMLPAVSLNYGSAAIITPSDFPFARDGILAEGSPNLEMMVIGELNLRTIEESRNSGTVLPLEDSRRTAELVRDP
ncbi:MAG TPA: carbon-nitrogen hydrolase family protein, partial [Thermoanaerobaculia bacterium]|nr:carbon-nitrogen hydrolase family protein [Thermoanaerobaculia bacterium]